MAPILREWSSFEAPQSNDIQSKQNDDIKDVIKDELEETPVVATLVETIPKIYRKGNLLLREMNQQVGHHINQGLATIPSGRGMNLLSVGSGCESSSRGLVSVPVQYEDVADTGEFHLVNGEWMEVVGEIGDEEDLFEDAFHNRPGPGQKIRNIFNRQRCVKGKDTHSRDHHRPAEGGGSGGMRERKGSRDKKLRGANQRRQKNYRNTPEFPVSAHSNKQTNNIFNLDSPTDIPFATPCMRQDSFKSKRGHTRQSAPTRQKMSRAAANVMKEVRITSDCEVSDLGTDVEHDPMSLSHRRSHSHTDTDLDIASSFDGSIRTPQRSWNYVMEEARNLLASGNVTESEVETDTDTEVVMNGRYGSGNSKLSKLKPFYTMQSSTRRRGVRTDTNTTNLNSSRFREYEERLEHVNHLVLSPPRKLRPRSADESTPGSPPPRVSTPPSYVFKKIPTDSTLLSKPSPITRRRSIAYNNTLKVVFVGSPNSGKTSLINGLIQRNRKPKKLKKSVDININTWSPTPINGDRQIKFNLWDVPGGSLDRGAHHATQSLFFSSHSLYVIVWDMSLNAEYTEDEISPDESYESDYDSDYEEAIMNEKRDRMIERDIDEQVMYWIDILSKSGLSNCALLPVVTFTDRMRNEEVNRRCDILMQRLLQLELDRRQGAEVPQLVFNAEGNIPKLSSVKENGIFELQQCLLDIANCRCRSAHPSFKHHFESKLCAVTVSVQNILNAFKEADYKIIPSDELLVKITENPPDVENFSHNLIHNALNFLSSIGSIMYYGRAKTLCTRPNILEDYIVLNPRWLSTALSLTLRMDPESALSKMREKSKSRQIGIEKLSQSLPILSSSETIEIWGHTEAIRKVGIKMSQDGLNNFYTFLQQLCEHCGILVPFKISSERKEKYRRSRSHETHYLLPMLAEKVPAKIWSYKVKETWKTTLCSSYLFPDKVPCSFMDKVAVDVVEDLLELAASDSSLKIQQIMYWKTAMYIKVAEEVVEADKKYTNVTDIFLHLIEHDSPYSVNSKNQSSTGRKLIVSGKGPEGGFGEKIWKLGYGTVLDSIESIASKSILFNQNSLKREIICPNCLLKGKPCEAVVWDRDEISHDDECILCDNGHETHPKLVLGPFEYDDAASVATGLNSVYSVYSTHSAQSAYTNNSTLSYVNADTILPAIVLVALWDRSTNQIIRVGSGFIADNRKGFIVTASHVLYNFDEDPKYGSIEEKYFGLSNATAVIGIHHGNDSAVFTYCADIVASDVYNVDGCVLQIKTKFERPVELDRNHLTERSEYPISSIVRQERLQRLSMTKKSEIIQREQEVRVIGFRQTGEGILAAGSRINRTACVNKGYVCRPPDEMEKQPDDIDEPIKFVPRSEIIVNCATGGGNSGGPFVNESGEVIGILSRADHVETQRCYLTPATELKALLKKARTTCKEEFYLPTYDTMEQF